MNEPKYLKELDSVCNSQKEMKHALEVLYKTIVLDGDIVVLSFNQLADSNLMVSFVKNDAMRKVLLNLFYNRRIKVSKFGSDKSAVRYIMRKIEDTLNPSSDKNFIFSAVNCLNMKKRRNKEEVLEILKETLQYNDLEHIETKRGYLKNTLKIQDDDINFLKNYAEFLIRISLSDVEYNDAKQGEKITFVKCMDIAISALDDIDVSKKLKNNLEKLKKDMGNNNVRSYWIDKFKRRFKRGFKRKKSNKKKYKIIRRSESFKNEMERIINVCSNLTIESSISYVPSIVDENDKKEYFRKKYEEISSDYKEYEHKYFWSEQNTDELLNFDDNDIKSWESFIRIIEDEEVHNKIIKKAQWKKIIKEHKNKDEEVHNKIIKKAQWKKIIKEHKNKIGRKAKLKILWNLGVLLIFNLAVNNINIIAAFYHLDFLIDFLIDFLRSIIADNYHLDYFIFEIIKVAMITVINTIGAIAIIDGLSKIFKTSNMFDLIFNKNLKKDKDTCNKIIKYLEEKNNNERNEK